MEKYSYVNRPNLEYIEEPYLALFERSRSRWALNGACSSKASSSRRTIGARVGGAVSSQELDVYNLINAYRTYGHFEANLNPLSDATKSFPELSFTNFNLKDEDLDKTFSIGAIVGKPNAQAQDIIAHLRDCYCRTISVQVVDAMPTVRDWFYNEFERNTGEFTLTPARKKRDLPPACHEPRLLRSSSTRATWARSASPIEGGDGLIPMLETSRHARFARSPSRSS